jgi:enoyl-CoA hydratase/carnithine racemase
MPDVSYELVRSTAVITLNRPARLNAFTPEMTQPFVSCLEAADRDDQVRAVVVTGAGRAFCAGADLAGRQAAFDFLGDATDVASAAARFRDPAGIITLRLLHVSKPVIAAINGPAVGIGASIVLPMDLRLAAEDALFAFPFTRRGMVPEGASSWFLPRAVGMSRAQDWICTGRTFGAGEACASGLVRAVYPPGELVRASLAAADEIAGTTSPVSVALARRMLWAGWNAEWEATQAHRRDSLLTALRGRSRDAVEGVAAFLDKRPPEFPQRVSEGLPPVSGWLGH